jgi:hypothetical protein
MTQKGIFTMYTELKIAGDVNTWTLSSPLDPGALTRADAPLTLAVTNPLEGTMVLSPATAGGVTLLLGGPPDGGPMDWIPGDDQVPLPFIYLPSGAGSSSPQDMYPMPRYTDSAALADEIASAMQAGTRLSLPYGNGQQDGTVVLNGARLPFAVVTVKVPVRQP